MKDITQLDPYTECVALHKDGTQRIGRLNHDRSHFQLASFQTRKVEIVWSVHDITDFIVIEWFPVGLKVV